MIEFMILEKDQNIFTPKSYAFKGKGRESKRIFRSGPK